MKTAVEVVLAGHNAFIHNNETFRITAGKGEMLYSTCETTGRVLAIEVSKVQEFITLPKLDNTADNESK